MKIQKSFKNTNPTLYIVATPIGNLQEMTPRAISILNDVDVIAAEDTRVTKKLLSYFKINTNLISHHKFNEVESSEGILEYLKNGKNVGLVSDAGYPLISDPGAVLVKRVVDAGFNVVSISGSCALLNALVASGITSIPFYFHGFLPHSLGDSKRVLEELKEYSMTLIFYESVHRIEKTLRNLLEIFGDREICLARELTKVYEEYYRGSVSDLLNNMVELKGEFVLVVEGKIERKKDVILSDLESVIELYQQEGLSASEAIKKVALEYDVSKNKLYRYIHRS